MRVVVTGASGQLGAYAVEALGQAGHEVIAWSGTRTGAVAGVQLTPIDLAAPSTIEAALRAADPDAVLHLAAVSAVEAVRQDFDRARRVNVEASRAIADWCAIRDRRLVFTSTDLVFDGSKPDWRESEPTRPSLAYGRTKVAAEHEVTLVPRGLIARIPLQFGPSRCGRESPIDRAIVALRRGEPITGFVDEYRTPLDYGTTARGLVALLGLDRAGVIHLAGRERISRHDLLRRIAAALGLDADLVRGNRQADVPTPEPRPADVSLNTERLGRWLPDFSRPAVEEVVAAW